MIMAATPLHAREGVGATSCSRTPIQKRSVGCQSEGGFITSFAVSKLAAARDDLEFPKAVNGWTRSDRGAYSRSTGQLLYSYWSSTPVLAKDLRSIDPAHRSPFYYLALANVKKQPQDQSLPPQ